MQFFHNYPTPFSTWNFVMVPSENVSTSLLLGSEDHELRFRAIIFKKYFFIINKPKSQTVWWRRTDHSMTAVYKASRG